MNVGDRSGARCRPECRLGSSNDCRSGTCYPVELFSHADVRRGGVCSSVAPPCDAARLLCATELQPDLGLYSIQAPTLRRVEALLPLSNRWVVVALSTLDDVVARIDEWEGGAYSDAIRRWSKRGQRSGSPDWGALVTIRQLRKQDYARARVAVGEKTLGKVAADFSITSPDDSRYVVPSVPTQIHRAFVGVGGAASPGGLETNYGVYVYLEAPSPFVNGKTYSVVAPGNRRATFLYDESHTVSRAIKVNQLGYLPGTGTNYAYVGGYIYDKGPLPLPALRAFEVVDANTGEVVFTGSKADGRLKLRDAASRLAPNKTHPDPSTRPLYGGEDLYELDLNGLTRPGVYFLRVPGIGRSWPFRVAADIYGEVFYTAMRGLFHQRGSFALDKPFTHWTRPRYHTAPVCESEYLPFSFGRLNDAAPRDYSRFDVLGATTDCHTETKDVIGGWYDAADYDRNIAHYTVIYDLLNLYEFSPEKFTDGQLNLPESGNGIPDILDEVEFGLRVWLTSMDSRGAVAGAVETSTHPRIDDAKFRWAFSRRTRFASLHFAAGAAHLSRLVAPFSPVPARKYRDAAIRAYTFGADPRNSLGTITIHAKKDRGNGASYSYRWTEEEWMNEPFLLLAKQQLFLLTGQPHFLLGVDALLDPKRPLARGEKALPRPCQWPYTEKDYSPWLYYALGGNPALAARTRFGAAWTGHLIAKADYLAGLVEQEPYRHSWERNRDFYMSWGATNHANHARALLVAYMLTKDTRYLRAARHNADFMLGLNPLGMVWTTGLGMVYPVDIQHEWSTIDAIKDPVPGITLYGITENHVYPALRNEVFRFPVGVDTSGNWLKDSGGNIRYEEFWDERFRSSSPAVPVWRRFSAHPHMNVTQCEFTVHETISSTIFMSGMLMNAGWVPSERLRKRGPRDERLLFGYWYLP